MKKSKVGSIALHTVRKFFPQVTHVEDANENLQVEVSPKDNNGRLKNHAECALAIACKRKEKADGVIISVKTAYVVKGKRAVRYRVTEAASREVISFDRKGGFEPGDYTLARPSAADRLGAGGSGPRTTTIKRRKPTFRHETANIRTSLRKEGV